MLPREQDPHPLGSGMSIENQGWVWTKFLINGLKPPPPIPVGQNDAFKVGLGIFISILIANELGSADVRELGSASGKKQ